MLCRSEPKRVIDIALAANVSAPALARLCCRLTLSPSVPSLLDRFRDPRTFAMIFTALLLAL